MMRPSLPRQSSKTRGLKSCLTGFAAAATWYLGHSHDDTNIEVVLSSILNVPTERLEMLAKVSSTAKDYPGCVALLTWACTM